MPKHTLEKRQPPQQTVLGEADIDLLKSEIRDLYLTLGEKINLNGSRTLI